MEIRRVVAGEFFTNCYVVWGGKPGIAVLIDPADDAPGLLRLLDGLGLIPEAVLLTHGHYDHILPACRRGGRSCLSGATPWTCPRP